MIINCKICGKDLPPFKNGFIARFAACECQKYQVVCLENGYIESETIKIDNYHLIFLPAYKEANVVESNDGDKKIINTFALDELTHELAVQWVNKLKTYVLFQ